MAEEESDGTTNLLRPRRPSVRRLLLWHFHWRCLLCSLLIAASGCHVTYCQLYGPKTHSLSHSPGPCSHGYNLIPMALGALLYMIYLSECWHYRNQLCSLPRLGAGQAEQLAAAMCRAVPLVWWKSVCYHYLRRTRQVTRYRNGNAVTRMQVFYERVNSHQSGNVFLYDQCGYKDISKQLAHLSSYPMVRVRFSKGFVFACLQAANEFEEQRSRFFDESNMLDDYMEASEGLDLANLPFVDRVLVFPEGKSAQARCRGQKGFFLNCWPNTARTSSSPRQPWWLSAWAFWPASLLLLSWPLRLLAECRTGHVHLQVTKLFGTSYLSPSSANYTGPLTRTSTMDSRELDAATRQDYLMVPSYSQAILLDPYQQQMGAPPVAGLFRQLFGSPSRNCAPQRPLVSHAAGPTDSIGYGSIGKQQQCSVGAGPTRSRSTDDCFSSVAAVDSNSNEIGPRRAHHGQTQPNGHYGRRHLPRPSALPMGHQQRRQQQLQRPMMPSRSVTISEGISSLVRQQRVDDDEQTAPAGVCCSDRMPLLMNSARHHQPSSTMAAATAASFPMAMLAEEPPPDEPPPPYEIALRYCSPIYQRLRQSVHSLSSLVLSSRRPSGTSAAGRTRDDGQFYAMDDVDDQGGSMG